MNKKRTSKPTKLSKKQFLYSIVKQHYVPKSVYLFMQKQQLHSIHHLLKRYSYLELWELQVLTNDSKKEFINVLRTYNLLNRVRIGKIDESSKDRKLSKMILKKT